MAPIDQVHLSFNPQTLTLLNAVLGLVMFGVALELRVEDFKTALRTPKALALGLAGTPHPVPGHDLCAGVYPAGPSPALHWA
jgi:predicted Na+-dependent transporter